MCKIFPNPISSNQTVSVKLNSNEISTIQIVDLAGKVVINKTINSDTQIHQINITDLPNGLYQVIFTDIDGSIKESKKLKIE